MNLSSRSRSVVCRPAASAPPRNSLEMQVGCPHTRPTVSDTRGVGLAALLRWCCSVLSCVLIASGDAGDGSR